MRFLIFCRVILLFAFLFSNTRVTCKSDRDNISEYNISLQINPVSGDITVNGWFRYMNPQNNSEKISIYLDSNMVFSKFLVNGSNLSLYNIEKSDIRYMPVARKINIDKKDLNSDENIFEFSYSGKLGKLDSLYANVVSERWSEIGLYYPWFPYCPEGKVPFIFNVSVKNIPGYDVFGLGRVEKKSDYTLISSLCPTNDIPICISEKVEHSVFKDDFTKINIFHNTDSSGFINRLSSGVLDVSRALQNLMHKKDSLEITIIESQRALGGGYARQGGIVLGGLSSDESEKSALNLKWYIAHEMAHLWWYRANTSTWEDWLNESFAEMSAALVIRDIMGEEFYKRVMIKKGELSQSTPPIWDFDRNGSIYNIAYKVLYNKGVYMLYQLEERIGGDAFLKLFSYLSGLQITSTVQLLEVIRVECGAESAEWFESMLKSST